MTTIAKCRTCGREENLAEPFHNGVCVDCLRKASGVALQPLPPPVAAVARLQPSPPVIRAEHPVLAPVEKRSVASPLLAGTSDFDEVFFDHAGVKVTRTRFIVSGQTYALNAITSVRQGFYVVKGDRLPLVLLIFFGGLVGCVGLGGLAGMLEEGSIGSAAISFLLMLIGATLCVVGFRQLRRIVDQQVHYVCLTTAAGEQTVCRSPDISFVAAIVKALNDAIVARG
jgi:Family of unknown function (DUF6232)